MLERPNIYAIYLKSWGFRDFKYIWHSPCVNPIQLGPTMQKKLFMSSFQAKFLNWVKKVTRTCSFLHVIFFCSQCQPVPGHIWAKKVPHSLPSNTQKMPKMAEYGPKLAKNSVWKIVVPFTFTLNRKKIAVYFLQIFTYSDRFRDMAFSSWNSCGSDFPNEFIASVQLN